MPGASSAGNVAVVAHKGRDHRCGGTYPAEVRPTRREKKKWGAQNGVRARKVRNVLYGDVFKVKQEASPKDLGEYSRSLPIVAEGAVRES